MSHLVEKSSGQLPTTMAGISITTGVMTKKPVPWRRQAPPALSETLVDAYQTPADSFPDTPEPWSTMAGGAYGGAAPKKPSSDFGLTEPSRVSQDRGTEAGVASASMLRITVRGKGESAAAAAEASAKKSKLLRVRNTFIDVGLPSPLEQVRQAHSCPGSRLVTPQSNRSGRLLSPLHDASVESSSAVSTVDTEEMAPQPKDIPSICFEQCLENTAPPSSLSTGGVHQLQTYDLPQQPYDPVLYEAPQMYSEVQQYQPAHMGYESQQRMYEMPPPPPPFPPQQQHSAPYQWSDVSYDAPAPLQQQQPAHPSCSSNAPIMQWGSEPLPTLLTGQGHIPVGPPAPTKPILQLDKALPVTANQGEARLGSPEMPTIGSAGHSMNECKPCAFYWKPQGCGNGVNCVFCHLCDSGEKKRRAKEKRVAMRIAKASGVYM